MGTRTYLFTDLRGFLLSVNRHVPSPHDADWPRATVAGSLVPGWESHEASDLELVVDPATLVPDPFAGDGRWLGLSHPVIPGQVPGSYAKDVRAVAQRAEALLVNTGMAEQALVGAELEFNLLEGIRFTTGPARNLVEIRQADGWSENETELGNGYRVGHRSMYLHHGPTDRFADVRRAICDRLGQIGIVPLHHGHEAGPSQQEIVTQPASIVQAADRLQLQKHVVRTVAIEHGLTATFMPRPLVHGEPNGLHVNLSLWRDGRNIFWSRDGLSEVAMRFIAGILVHVKSLNALANPTVNSYKRLNYAYSLMRDAGWGYRNRTAAIRVPHFSGEVDCRIEVRFPDPSANPYLAFAALLCAGIDGVRRELKPPAPQTDSPAWGPAAFHAAACAPNAMAADLKKALAALSRDQAYLVEPGVFAPQLLQSLIHDGSYFWHWASTTPAPQEYQVFFGL